MKFLIKNYNKDADNNREILATVLFEVETIKEAKEKYADILKNEEKSKIEKERQKVESDIENYKNLLRESEEKLEKLKAEEGNLKK